MRIAVVATAGADSGPWRLSIEKLRLDDIALAVVDESRGTPIALDVGALGLGLKARLESGPAGVTGVAEDLGLTLSGVAARERDAKTPLIDIAHIVVERGRGHLTSPQGTLRFEAEYAPEVPVQAVFRK